MRKKTIIIEDAPSDGSGQPSRGRWLLGIAQSAFGLKRYGIGICLFLFAGILNTTFAAAPVITSQPTNQTVVAGNNAAFSVTATGTPTPTVSEFGNLPAGITFTPHANGTGTLAGTATQTGTYQIGFVASNGEGSNATQFFTLTIGALQITTASLPPATVGGAYSSMW